MQPKQYYIYFGIAYVIYFLVLSFKVFNKVLLSKEVNKEMGPEEEFLSIISPFSMVKEHLKPAKNIRPWVWSENIQYSSKGSLGHRQMITNNTYGFVDPLYSMLGLGQVLFHDLCLQRLCFKYFESGDTAIFEGLIIDGRPGDDAPFMEQKKAMFKNAEKALKILKEIILMKMKPVK